MKKLWTVLCTTVVAASLAAPAQAAVVGNDDNGPLCAILGFLLPDCKDDTTTPPPPPGVSQAAFDAFVQQQNANNTNQQNAIDKLEDDVDALEAQVAELQGFLDDCSLFVGKDTDCNGACVNTDEDENNCGECGTKCKADEQCNIGNCEPKVCDALACNQASVDANGDCHYTPVNERLACNDDKTCTTGERCYGGTCRVPNGTTDLGPGGNIILPPAQPCAGGTCSEVDNNGMPGPYCVP